MHLSLCIFGMDIIVFKYFLKLSWWNVMLTILISSERRSTLVSHSVYLNNLANVEIQRSMKQNALYVWEISESIKS